MCTPLSATVQILCVLLSQFILATVDFIVVFLLAHYPLWPIAFALSTMLMITALMVLRVVIVPSDPNVCPVLEPLVASLMCHYRIAWSLGDLYSLVRHRAQALFASLSLTDRCGPVLRSKTIISLKLVPQNKTTISAHCLFTCCTLYCRLGLVPFGDVVHAFSERDQ